MVNLNLQLVLILIAPYQMKALRAKWENMGFE